MFLAQTFYCGDRLNSKFYFQAAKVPVPPRNFSRIVEDPGYELGRASSNFTEDSCRGLQHSAAAVPQTVNEIGLAGFPLYHDRDLEKYNIC
jgi:hypothetical protein